MTGKGNNTPVSFRRQSLHGAKQRLMSKMHPVKKSQGVDVGSHRLVLCNKIGIPRKRGQGAALTDEGREALRGSRSISGPLGGRKVAWVLPLAGEG